ncbi:MAG: hypothetical protein KJN89_08665 [Gammaproteobacteria bacterium]|nr:hypothetical protein [Gammaproteobacteria bacterium]MBT8133677.1 hypothetical protein [Gammaproteobacteria bacterium]NNJ50437.1 hypothetical protein [Gammaproteobacteria bacterium]
MDKVEVTWSNTLIIWWSYVWRCILISMVVGFILGAIGGVIVGVMGKPDMGGIVGGILGYLGSIPVSIYVMKVILNKKYNKFSIALIPQHDT